MKMNSLGICQKGVEILGRECSFEGFNFQWVLSAPSHYQNFQVFKQNSTISRLHFFYYKQYNFFYLNLHSNWPKRLFQFKMFFSIFLIFTLIFSKNVAAQSSEENFGISAEYMEGLTEGKLQLENRQIGLHYVTGGNPDAPNLLIFVHGFPQFWYAWRHQLQYFSKMEQYQVYAFDLRGFGKSDRPLGVLNYTMDEHVEDIAEAIQMLKAKGENGNKLWTLVTHDIGAAIGSMLNYKYPKLVDAFVMMNAPNPRTIKGMLKEGKLNFAKMIKTPYFYKILAFQFPLVGEKVVKGNNFEFFDKLFLTDNGAILNQGNGETFNGTDLEVYKKAYSQKGAVTSALNFFRAPLRKAVHDIGKAILAIFSSPEEDENSGKLVDKIEAKCLVIWGESDAAFGLEFGEAAANACKNGQLVPVNSSHWVPEDVPQKVNKLIEKFVVELK